MEQVGYRRANRDSRGSRRWRRREGRLLGAALQSLVSHANTHDRYSCNKGAIYTNQSIKSKYMTQMQKLLNNCTQRHNEARL